MLREILDDPDVGFCGTMRVITSLEFLQHHFAKMGHRDLLVTHNLFQRKQLSFSGSRARGSVRRASGFVQILISLTEVARSSFAAPETLGPERTTGRNQPPRTEAKSRSFQVCWMLVTQAQTSRGSRPLKPIRLPRRRRMGTIKPSSRKPA